MSNMQVRANQIYWPLMRVSQKVQVFYNYNFMLRPCGMFLDVTESISNSVTPAEWDVFKFPKYIQSTEFVTCEIEDTMHWAAESEKKNISNVRSYLTHKISICV